MVGQKALNGNQKQLNLFFDKMLDGFSYHKIVVDKSGKPVDYIFVEVNCAFEQMTGLKREQIIGKKVTDVLVGIEKDPADWIGIYGKVALTGEPVQFENHAEPLDKWFKVSAYCPEKGYFVALFDDISERKKAEQLALESAKKLKDAERLAAIGATAGMVGHDIRNPLQAITGDIYLAKTELASTPERREKEH